MNDPTHKLEQLEWVGGHAALDFVNTVNGWYGGKAGAEYLHRYADVIRWHQLAGLIGPRGSRALCRGSNRAQGAALRRALGFRASLHKLFRAVANGGDVPQPEVDSINEVIHKTAAWRRLAADGRRVCCGWDFEDAPPDAVLGPVAWEAADLLEHGSLERIKECPEGDGCGWLFLDSSRNRSRTWCSMRTCGNSAKVRRFRERHS